VTSLTEGTSIRPFSPSPVLTICKTIAWTHSVNHSAFLCKQGLRTEFFNLRIFFFSSLHSRFSPWRPLSFSPLRLLTRDSRILSFGLFPVPTIKFPSPSDLSLSAEAKERFFPPIFSHLSPSQVSSSRRIAFPANPASILPLSSTRILNSLYPRTDPLPLTSWVISPSSPYPLHPDRRSFAPVPDCLEFFSPPPPCDLGCLLPPFFGRTWKTNSDF